MRGFIDFFPRGWRVADPAVVSLCGNFSTFGLPFPMSVYSLCCLENDAVTSLKRKAFWQLPLRIDGERVSVTLCAGPHMYDLMHSPPQRETVGHRWCHRHWCLPAWPHNVSSGASATYFGGHGILESTVSYFPLLSRRFRSYTDAFFGVICQKDTVCVFTLKWAEQDFGEKVKILWCFLL